MEIVVKQCESARWLAWPKDREDIVASGETKDDAVFNIKEMYTTVIEYEAMESPLNTKQ
jgi:predicted RNase H-like HicB family nuclease